MSCSFCIIFRLIRLNEAEKCGVRCADHVDYILTTPDFIIYVYIVIRVVDLFRMLMPKKNRIAIYEYLFKEGVMVAKKDFHAPKHPELEAIPNLHVIKAMQVM